MQKLNFQLDNFPSVLSLSLCLVLSALGKMIKVSFLKLITLPLPSPSCWLTDAKMGNANDTSDVKK